MYINTLILLCKVSEWNPFQNNKIKLWDKRMCFIGQKHINFEIVIKKNEELSLMDKLIQKNSNTKIENSIFVNH